MPTPVGIPISWPDRFSVGPDITVYVSQTGTYNESDYVVYLEPGPGSTFPPGCSYEGAFLFATGPGATGIAALINLDLIPFPLATVPVGYGALQIWGGTPGHDRILISNPFPNRVPEFVPPVRPNTLAIANLAARGRFYQQ